MNIGKVFTDFLVSFWGAYGTAFLVALTVFVLRWVAAHAKNARLKVIASLALDAVSSVDNKDLENPDKKKEAVEKLNETVSNNLGFGTITEDELDMRVEGALQRLRIMQVTSSSNTGNEEK